MPHHLWEMMRVLFEGAFAIAKPTHTNKRRVRTSPFRDESYWIQLKLQQEPCWCQLLSLQELSVGSSQAGKQAEQGWS